MAAEVCQHLDAITEVKHAQGRRCEECVKIDDRWMHLRMCLQCGKVGCCDNSPNRHATGHFEETGHPLIRSAEPYEEWRWCYIDQLPIL